MLNADWLSESLSLNSFISADYPFKARVALCNVKLISGTGQAKVTTAKHAVSKCLNPSR